MTMGTAAKRVEFDEAEPLNALLGRLAGELADLASAVEALEADLSVPADQVHDAARVMRVQTIDLTVQRLNGLRQFVGTIANSVPDTLAVDASAALALMTLSDMRARLSGANALHDGDSDDQGAIELF